MVFVVLLLAPYGCSSKPKGPPPVAARPKTLRVVHHVGGTHHRLVMHDDTWFQTFGSSMMMIEPKSVEVVRVIELGKLGDYGPALDLIHVNDTSGGADAGKLIAVLKDDEVVVLSLENPRLPQITRRISAETLGVRPRALSVVNNEVYVSGRGGVVRLSDLTKVMASDQIVGRVVTSDHGLVTTIGRRVIRLDNQQFVGAATSLWPLPDTLGVQGGFAFALQNENAALVGLMTSNVRELDAQKTTVAVPGTVHSVRFIGDLIWVVSDQGLRGYRLEEGALKSIVHSDVLGARDVGPVDHNHVAVAGSIGRALYRIAADEEGPGDQFLKVHREPGFLPEASSDGRYILAGGSQGMWLYLVNSRVEQTTQTREVWPPSPQSASTVGATAQIAADGLSVNIMLTDRTWTYEESGGYVIRCISAINGQFWLGHDRGITVIKPDGGFNEALLLKRRDPPPLEPIAGRLRIEGPVLHIYPLLIGGGASFVSKYGGMGVAKFVEDSVNP